MRSPTTRVAHGYAAAASRTRCHWPPRARPSSSEAARGSMSAPRTRYAKSGDTSIAYQTVGDGPVDLVLVLGFATHLELQWDSPPSARFFERLSSFSRL